MTKVVCPHCDEELGFEDICWKPLKKDDTEKQPVVYYCPKCRKILGITKD